MSEVRIYYAAVEAGFNRVVGQAVYFDGLQDYRFFTYKQPEGEHSTAGWHICEVSSGVAIARALPSFAAAYEAACQVFATTPAEALGAKIHRAIGCIGRAPEPEELRAEESEP